MDVSAAIAEITDREQIRELTHQYCFALDGGDLRELAGLFAESARLIIEYPERPVRQFEGRQAIYEFYRGFYQRVEILRHKVKNQIIELRGDQAVSRCYWDSINSAANTLSAGHYFDTLRRYGQGWKFEERLARVAYQTPLARAWSRASKEAIN